MKRGLLLAVVALVLAGGVAGYVWTAQMREIRLCRAVRAFHAEHQRPPATLDELPGSTAHLFTAPEGGRYRLGCSGSPVECSLSWTESGRSSGRNCGLREPGALTNWF